MLKLNTWQKLDKNIKRKYILSDFDPNWASQFTQIRNLLSKIFGEKALKIEPIDLKDYTKFVLKEGSPLEQRSILECVSSELILKNGKVLIK